MSLVGSLEDLSLPDLLQIVSLSRKSGILMLARGGQQGKIIIREGRVIQTVSPRTGTTLGELLVSRGLLATEDLRRALEIQRGGDSRELLGSILVRLGLIGESSLEQLVQEQIEDAIGYFLSWKEGTFSFELADIKSRGEFSVDPQAFILERGIDTQWLVLEGSRLVDERARPAAAVPAAAAAALPAPPAGLGRAEEALLSDMLRELQGLRAASELGLLVLRFAAELLGRAVLFIVKGDTAVGLGGFGVEVPGGPERRGIRGIAIPLGKASILAEVVARQATVQGPPGPARLNRELLDRLGGATPTEAVALPLISGGKVRLVLYGDNLPEGRPLAGIRALETFLAHAGRALERAILERRQQEGSQRGS